MLWVWNLDSQGISTRSHLDPNPHTIVDDLERILRKNSKTEDSTIVRPIHKESSVPENLTSLQDTQFDLHHRRNLFRTKSQNWID